MNYKKITTLVLIFLLCSLVLLGRTYRISKSYKAQAKSNRIKYIVLHYTYSDREISLRALTGTNVSSHYFITDVGIEPIYKLLDEEYGAWHAGPSTFDGRTAINDTSIGIEIVHTGYVLSDTNLFKNKNKLNFVPYDDYIAYDEKQIDKVVYLLKKLIKEFEIHPKNILGHSDIAPLRKQDPGPKFPWKWLYEEHGIGVWYDDEVYSNFLDDGLYKKASVSNIKQEFINYGYTSMTTNNTWDKESRTTLYAFQSRFQTNKMDGNIDNESYAIIRALNKKVADINKKIADEKASKLSNNLSNLK